MEVAAGMAVCGCCLCCPQSLIIPRRQIESRAPARAPPVSITSDGTPAPIRVVTQTVRYCTVPRALHGGRDNRAGGRPCSHVRFRMVALELSQPRHGLGSNTTPSLFNMTMTRN